MSLRVGPGRPETIRGAVTASGEATRDGRKAMAQLLPAESTSFTLDNMGRFLCNTLQEARDSAWETVGGRTRDFDVIVIGGGTFGAVVAEHLFISDATRSRRILVLEAGPFVLPEHRSEERRGGK